MSDSILSGLREYKTMRRKIIKLQTFPGATISDMKIFTVPLVKKKPDKPIIQKMIPSTKTIISSPVLRVDIATSHINNKKITSLLNFIVCYCIHNENTDEFCRYNTNVYIFIYIYIYIFIYLYIYLYIYIL